MARRGHAARLPECDSVQLKLAQHCEQRCDDARQPHDGRHIAGIAIGATAVILLGAAFGYFVRCANTHGNALNHHTKTKGHLSYYSNDGASSALLQSPTPSGVAGFWKNRFSGLTQFRSISPHTPPSGTFVGYNSRTGAPEFAQDVPALALVPGDGDYYHYDIELSPPFGRPYSGRQETAVLMQERHELQGETPPIAEVGPYN
jgi:hypothetical protein